MSYLHNTFLLLRKYLSYNILRKFIAKTSTNLGMSKRILIVKKINSFCYKPWLKMRKNIFDEKVFKLNSLKVSDGFLIDDSFQLPFIDDAINDCLKICDFPVENVKKSYLINHLDSKKLFDYKGLLSFCTSPLLVGTVAEYLGEFPVISSIQVWNSPPSDTHDAGVIGSQEFHLDNVSDRQMKVFVNLINIDNDNGPFSFISEMESNEVFNKISYGNVKNIDRIEDEDVYNIVKSSELKQNTGPSGLVTLIDTCRCLHFGSRNTKYGRKLLMVQYTSIARADTRPFDDFPNEIKDSEFNKLLFNPFHYQN